MIKFKYLETRYTVQSITISNNWCYFVTFWIDETKDGLHTCQLSEKEFMALVTIEVGE